MADDYHNVQVVTIDLGASPSPIEAPRRRPPQVPSEVAPTYIQHPPAAAVLRDVATQTVGTEPSVAGLLAMIAQQQQAFERRLEAVSAREVALAVWEAHLKKTHEDHQRLVSAAGNNASGRRHRTDERDLAMSWEDRLAVAQAQLAAERAAQRRSVFALEQ
jgi:hypothetical protein